MKLNESTRPRHLPLHKLAAAIMILSRRAIRCTRNTLAPFSEERVYTEREDVKDASRIH